MQKYVYENMVNRFCLSDMNYSLDTKTKYFLYDLQMNGGVDKLTLVDKKASTVANLLKAFTHQPTPSLDDFIELLQGKVKLRLNIE